MSGWQSDRSRFRRRRADLLRFQGRRCYLCGKRMKRPSDDHVVPKRMGGRRGRNILLAHRTAPEPFAEGGKLLPDRFGRAHQGVDIARNHGLLHRADERLKLRQHMTEPIYTTIHMPDKL